ncbi:Hint domain-containing protein [Ruegeria marina]|uniref:Hint domain-containing protein n=1 Tax=Ruegeria marina TaxID=639004 RepID=A0A1G6QHJ0_9RHOB|nr:Hint domain-containing protein [Ruegeria marina]SDC91394.1 Hint domain-containing protein [Ruegeria marina]
MSAKAAAHAAGGISHSNPDIAPVSEAGFLAGTILLTQDGELPVEFLSPGDRIISRDRGLVPLRHITRAPQTVRAIRFAAGSLGDTRPDCDLVLPAGQPVLIRDWRAQALFGTRQALVRADALVDGEFVCDLGPRVLHLFQLHFDVNHVLYAGGLEVAGQCLSVPGRLAA